MNSKQRRARRARAQRREAPGLPLAEGAGTTVRAPDHINPESPSSNNELNPMVNYEVISTPRAAGYDARRSAFFINPPPKPKREVVILHGGANRGAAENAPVFVDFNRRSTATELVPVYVDPVIDRAEERRSAVEKLGIRAGAIEGRIEDVVLSIGSAASEPFVLHIDRMGDIAQVYRRLSGTSRTFFGYILLVLPTGRLLGLAYLSRAEDSAHRSAAATTFATLGDVSERNTSEMVVGRHADPAHALLEPTIRRWFRRHTFENLNKVVAGTEPAANPFEVTTDGRTTQPLFVVTRKEWSDAERLAIEVVDDPPMPIRRGASFVVAETVPDVGVRFHDVRRRTDGRVVVDGVEVVDRDSVGRAVSARALEEALRASAARQAEEVRLRTARETLSRQNPIWTTD